MTALFTLAFAVVIVTIGGESQVSLAVGGFIVALIAVAAPPEWLMVGVIMTASVNYSVLLDNRIAVGSYPISIGDLVVIAYAYYGIVRLWHDRRPQTGGAMGLLLIIWLIYNSLVGVGIGLLERSTTYGILQEYRLVLYTAIAYFVTVLVFRPKRHLRSIILGQVAAGVLVSLWQLAITISGRGLGLNEIVTLEGAGRTLRDINLPLSFAGTALVLLTAVHVEAPQVLGKARHFTWVLVPLFISASVLSLTRTVWFSIVLSGLLSLLLPVIGAPTEKRFCRLILVGVSGIVFAAVVFGAIRLLLPETYEALAVVWNATFSFQDISFWERVEQPLDLWSYFWSNPSAFWFGEGFGSISTGAVQYGPFTNIHNAYLWYMVFGGLLGLLLFVVLWTWPLIVYVRVRRSSSDSVERAFAAASIVNWIVTSAVMLGSPALWTNAALTGLQLGVASRLAARARDSEPASLVRRPRLAPELT